jgi:hypothetical protein
MVARQLRTERRAAANIGIATIGADGSGHQ